MTPVEFAFSSLRSKSKYSEEVFEFGSCSYDSQGLHKSWRRFPCLWAEESWGMEMITVLPKHNWKYDVRQRTVQLLKFFLPTPGVCWIRHNAHWGGTGRLTGNVEEHPWEEVTAWHCHQQTNLKAFILGFMWPVGYRPDMSGNSSNPTPLHDLRDMFFKYFHSKISFDCKHWGLITVRNEGS